MSTEEQQAAAEAIREGVVHSADVYLKRISDDMRAIRQDFTKLFKYIDRAESRVPEDFRRLSMVFHDVHDCRNAYVEMGIPVPPYLDRIIELMSDAFKHAVEDLEAHGGAFHKTRQEVVKRGDFRYDHNTPLLAAAEKHAAKETPDA
jgi:hypothetical protein